MKIWSIFVAQTSFQKLTKKAAQWQWLTIKYCWFLYIKKVLLFCKNSFNVPEHFFYQIVLFLRSKHFRLSLIEFHKNIFLLHTSITKRYGHSCFFASHSPSPVFLVIHSNSFRIDFPRPSQQVFLVHPFLRATSKHFFVFEWKIADNTFALTKKIDGKTAVVYWQ